MRLFKKQSIDSSLEALKFNSGIYLLVIELKDDLRIRVGSLGEIEFKKGIYCYVGSAQKNLIQRLKRHLRKDKKLHWHIDYFLKHAKIKRIFVSRLNKEYESIIAKEMEKTFPYIKNFGNSDAKDRNDESHLFYIVRNQLNFFEGLIKNFGFVEIL